ncbi:GAF domain-containing protein [candidate division KSB1 bacterium]|nr:GAF domain-containing protein [bacterium]NUM63836.1 GAF domain-containing protein [candidate division KSB1 bacterium]
MAHDRSHLDGMLLSDLLAKAVTLTQAERGCLLLHDPVAEKLECFSGERCPYLSAGSGAGCALELAAAPAGMQQFFDKRHNGDETGGYIAAAIEFPASRPNGSPSPASQMLIPLRRVQDKPLGLLILESNQRDYFQQEDIAFAQTVAEFCALAISESQKFINSDRMIQKLGLLSAANNVLLAEFENRSLAEKFDYIVEKATEILDAELCSLWLAKGDSVILETSFAQDGKVRNRERVVLSIVDGPKSGMTGHIAFHRKVFNSYGQELENHPARNSQIPAEFVFSKRVYSELAYPMLEEDGSLLGLLLAYNKKDAQGKPLKNTGFSREFDEPLMKILTTKLVISLKNARLLKKLRDYELIVESTPDPVVMCSKRGEITYMNPGACNLFGELVGCHVSTRYPTDEHTTGLEKAQAIRWQLLKARDKRVKNYETEFLGKNGEAIPLSLSVAVLRDENGRDAGTIGIAKDLREIKALLAAGQSLLETHNVDEILQQITQVCLRLPHSIRAYIKRYDERTDHLVFCALSSKSAGETFPEKSTPKDRGMTGNVFQTQQPMLSNNVALLPINRYYGIFKDVKSKIVVPITYRDKETGASRRLGVLSVDSNTLDAFSPSDVYFLSTLANQAAVALENANLIAAKNRIITKLRAFDKVQQAATGKDLNEDRILESVLDAVVEILGFAYATISKVDHEIGMIGTVKGRNVPQEFIDSAWHDLDSKDIQAWVVRHKTPEYLAGWDDRLDKDIYERFGHARYVRTIIPIFARGEVLGTLETGYVKAEKAAIEADEIETLQRIVNLAGLGIEQANLVKQMKEELDLRTELEMQLEALNQASFEILNAMTEKEVIGHISASLKNIGYSRWMLSLVNETANTIEGHYAAGENWKAIVHETKRELKGTDILAQALRAKASILSEDCAKDPTCNQDSIKKAGIKSQFVIPLIVKDKAVGTLQIDLTDRQDLVSGDKRMLRRRMKVVETFARQVAVAIRNIRALMTIDRLESNIAEAAHEFRSPLHNILTQVGGLKDFLEHSQPDKDIDQFVSAIEEEIHRAKRQVDNTLLLSDRTREHVEYVFKSGFLREVVENCAAAYRLRALERGLRLIIKDSVKHLPRLEFDRGKMEQAFTNLIDNAVKYSHSNRYIDVSGMEDDDKVHIEITDRGLGIPEHDFETIFLGFARGDTKDKMRYIPGTGLGLKICREIIEKHGGEIRVSSVPYSRNPDKIKTYQDYLTTFRVSLPKFRRER